MSIRVECPKCGKGIKAPSKYAGKLAKCPGCGGKIRFPIPPADDSHDESHKVQPSHDAAEDRSFTPIGSSPKRFLYGPEGVALWSILIVYVLWVIGVVNNQGQGVVAVLLDSRDFQLGLLMCAFAYIVGCNRPVYGWRLLAWYFAVFCILGFGSLGPEKYISVRILGAWLIILAFLYVTFGLAGEYFVGSRRARRLKS